MSRLTAKQLTLPIIKLDNAEQIELATVHRLKYLEQQISILN